MRRFTRAQRLGKESSTELAALCKRSSATASYEAVKRYIDSGADPHYREESSMPMPILHTFIEAGNVGAVKACLSTSKRVDFTLTDKRCRKTPLHCLCQLSLSDEKTAAMLQLVVERLEKHPDDRIQWVQEDDEGSEFLSCAARNQQLSLVWSIVRDVPFFAEQTEPLTLLRVWEWDWNALGRDEQVCFSLPEDHYIRADQHTGMLSKLFLRGNPDPKKVEACVSKGADIFFKVDGLHSPLFHMFVWYGFVDCVRACLTTPSAIDFSTKDISGYTALHCLCFGDNPPDVISQILHLILDRLQRNAPNYFDVPSVCLPPLVIATSASSSSLSAVDHPEKGNSNSNGGGGGGGVSGSVSGTTSDSFNNNNNNNSSVTMKNVMSEREAFTPVNSPKARLQGVLNRGGGGGGASDWQPPTPTPTQEQQPQQRKKKARLEGVEEEIVVEDSIDWDVKSDAGHTFLSTAAGNGILSVVWVILKQRRVKYVVHHIGGPISITCEMVKADYYQIPQEDRELFSTRPFFKS